MLTRLSRFTPLAAAAVSFSGVFGLNECKVSKCEAEKGTKTKKARFSGEWDENWDLRNDEKHRYQKSIHQIVLIRHGQYANSHLEHQDHQHVLTQHGRLQATRTGKRLNELLAAGTIYPIDRVYYSTMVRATETWNLIKPEISNKLPSMHRIQPCNMIREGAVCKPNPPSPTWLVTETDFILDGLRVEAAFRNYMHRASFKKVHSVNENGEDIYTFVEKGNHSTVFVCHGNVIRYFVMRALQLPPEAWLRTAVWNASITILEIHPSGKVSLRCMGDVGHFPPDFITYN